MVQFNIDIVSDTVCPWCYVGQKKLSKAISDFTTTTTTSHTFQITWKPFYLNPTAPLPSVSKASYFASKFPGARIEELTRQVTEVGALCGIAFSFDGKMGNTRDSHRLIYFAGMKEKEKEEKVGGLQDEVVQKLFKAYFEKERDITDLDVLREVAVEAGLDGEEVKGFLESGAGGDEVDREAEEARRKGVTGVPHFTVNGVFELGGAQDSGAFVEAFRKIAG